MGRGQHPAVRDLADPGVLRPALDALALRMDGKPAAASTVARKRAIFYNAAEYAVELGHLSGNPVASIKWWAPKVTEAVNPRMINHGRLARFSTRCGRKCISGQDATVRRRVEEALRQGSS